MSTLDYDNLLDQSGNIKPECVNDLLVEVINGKYLFQVDGSVYASRVPAPADLDTARMIFAKKFMEYRSAGFMTREELERLAIETGEFDPVERAEKVGLQRRVGDLMKTRDQTPSAQQKVFLASQINQAQKRLRELIADEEYVFQNSAESRAEEHRADYLTSRCTMGGEFLDQHLWPEWQEYLYCTDQQLLLESRRAHLRVSHGLPVNIIRALARTQEWRQRWRAAKDTQSPVFEGHSATWDQNKLNLISWSDFFDSVLRHPECPGEDIIYHDANLQLWVNAQVAEAKKQKAARKNAGAGSGGRTLYVSDPSGRKRPMTNLGRTTTQINQAYRIPSRE